MSDDLDSVDENPEAKDVKEEAKPAEKEQAAVNSKPKRKFSDLSKEEQAAYRKKIAAKRKAEAKLAASADDADKPEVSPSVRRVELAIYYGNTAFVVFGIFSYMMAILAYLLDITPFLIFMLAVPTFYKWAVTGGALYAIAQLFYGVLQYIRSENKDYLQHCWSSMICGWGYIVLYMLYLNGLYLR